MSSHGDQLKYALGFSAVTSLYGVASLIVWFGGDYFGYGYTERIILVLLILITLPFVILINYFRKRRARKIEEAAAAGDASAATNVPASPSNLTNQPAGAYPEVETAAAEAFDWLRSSKLAQTKQNSREAAYALPLYVVAGAPAAGKTALLISSGMAFHTLPSQREADQNLIKPTRHAEWRVSDEAILLDTSGRYQTEGETDRDEWSALLETLKKHRDERALDGFVIAANSEEIIRSPEAEVERQAKVLRARLDETIARTGVKFPVYLVFTHADAIKGFREFFGRFPRQERTQVWGATLPLAQNGNAHQMFDGEFALLHSQLMRRRLKRLTASERAKEQLRVFNFPVRFGEMRDPFSLFVAALFRPNPFSENPIFRGFYFTSSPPADFSQNSIVGAKLPHRPNAADASMTMVGGTAQLTPDAANATDAAAIDEAGSGTFTTQLLRDVLLRDRDIARALQAGRRKQSPLRWIGAAAAGLLLALLLGGFLASYINNRRLVARATEAGAAVEEIVRTDAGSDPATKTATEAAKELRAVERLRVVLAELDNNAENGAPLLYRFGLYSGNDINPRLRATYFEAINRRFIKKTIIDVEKDLAAYASGTTAAASGSNQPSSNANNQTTNNQTAASTQPVATNEDADNRGYELFKTYLMLGLPDKADAQTISTRLAPYWKRYAPPGTDGKEAQRQLDFYAEQVASADAPHIANTNFEQDTSLVTRVRRRLANYPVYRRIYSRITAQVNRKSKPVSLDTIGGGAGVISGTYQVRRSWTAEGMAEVFAQFDTAAENIDQDNWVTGERAGSTANKTAELSKLRDLYTDDYINQWQNFLKDARVNDFQSKEEATRALKILAGADSPLDRVLNTTVRNTHLSAQPEANAGGFVNWVKSFWSSDKKGATFPGTEKIETEFAQIAAFVGSSAGEKTEQKETPISKYRALLSQAGRNLSAPDTQLGQTSQQLLTANKNNGWLQTTDTDVKALTENFKSEGDAAGAELINRPVGNLKGLLFRNNFEQIEAEWQKLYAEAARIENSGFPFRGNGEAKPNEITAYLNPVDGKLTVFFRDYLATQLEDAGGQWRKKEGGFNLSNEFIDYLNNARRLRDALFPQNSARMKVEYGLTLQPVQNIDIRIEVDGKTVETRGDAKQSAQFSFPAPAGSSSGATITATGGETENPPKTYTGAWGLFQMFKEGGGERARKSDGYALAWRVGEANVQATLQPSNTLNPFEMTLFTNLRAPQTLRGTTTTATTATNASTPASETTP